MSCSPFDLRDYLLRELAGPQQRRQVEAHVKTCAPCREELDRLRITEAALLSLADEEIPQRIAFVSDKIFEPSPWRRWLAAFWNSGARLGFVSAAMLSASLVLFALKQAPTGILVAGTNHGMYALERNASLWRPMNVVVIETTVKTPRKGSRKALTTTTVKKSQLESRVNDLELGSGRWLSATTTGIYASTDQGKTWKGGELLGQTDFVSVREEGSTVVGATHSSVLVSTDSGSTWKLAAPLPSYVVSIRSVAIASDSEIMVAAREGAFRSGDGGATWEHVANGIPSKDITSVSFDPTRKRLLATSDATGVIFESRDGGRSWQRGPDSGFPLRRVSVIGGRFVGATPFDGVILQPEDESISAAAAAGGSE